MAIGRGPGDVVGLQLCTAGDRSPADTIMDFVVPVDGYYPVRLTWFETGGGSECEFFFVDTNGVYYLLNDLTAPAPVKAYRESPATPPYIARALPPVGYNWTFADQDVVLDVHDGAAPMNDCSAALTINGTPQTLTAAKNGVVTTLTRKSSMSNLLASGANNAVLTYTYNDPASGGATKTVTNSWVFNVPPYTRPIPVANKVAASEVSGTGFHVRVHQLDKSLDANQGNGGRYTGQNGGGSSMPRPEIQFSNGYINRTNNLPYPNLATAGPSADGGYDITDVLNMNSAQSTGGPAANAGIFNGDVAVTGLPGQGTSNFGLDNTVHEFTTYLDLKAGVHILGINVDDGWLCISAPNPHDTLGTLLGWRNSTGGQNGNPVHYPNAAFTALVLEDGIYPVRILFWQGGGGVNFEFLSLDRNIGAQMLVNDLSGAFPQAASAPGGGPDTGLRHHGLQHLHRPDPAVDQVLGLSDAHARDAVAKHPPAERAGADFGQSRRQQSCGHRQRRAARGSGPGQLAVRRRRRRHRRRPGGGQRGYGGGWCQRDPDRHAPHRRRHVGDVHPQPDVRAQVAPHSRLGL